MKNNDHNVLLKVLSWLKNKEEVFLFTVIQTWGSSPCPPGSLLAISENGKFTGSVSGGCVEQDLIDKVKSGSFKQATCVENYGLSAAETRKYGLPCGGKLVILVERKLDYSQFETILEKLQKRQSVNRQTCLSTLHTSLQPTQSTEFSYKDNIVNKVYGPLWRLIIIGAGQLSSLVSDLAILLDYDTYICDPRENYQYNWNDSSTKVITSMPDDTILKLNPDSKTAIVALTHDPKLDDMGLLEALQSEAFYIGALGSRKSTIERRKRLLSLGLNSPQVNRLHGPIGLDIGSKTLAEISVSIMAEITATRNNLKLVLEP